MYLTRLIGPDGGFDHRSMFCAKSLRQGSYAGSAGSGQSVHCFLIVERLKENANLLIFNKKHPPKNQYLAL
jgi:hypothetical protein